MATAPNSVSSGKSAAFIGRLLLRAFGFALIGAVSGAIIGALNGAWSGAALALPELLRGRPFRSVGMGGTSIFGVYVAFYVGLVSGTIAFFITSLVAWRVRLPYKAVDSLLRAAAKGATLGTLIGGTIAATNYFLFARFLNIQTRLSLPAGFIYICGVILGFILGLFYMTIRAALCEVKRQREETRVEI